MKTLLRFVAVFVIVVAFGATVEAVRYRSMRDSDRELMRIGVEDIARRVRETSANLATVTELNNRAIISKAKHLAQIVARSPSILENHQRFATICKSLDVDEIHVSDEKGILIQSVPKTSIGFDMNSADQPRPFMAAITNRSFELVQEPLINAIAGKYLQYAGVARIDKPGIVQVGQLAERVLEARKLADIESIATSVRIGREGRVHISKITNASSPVRGMHIEQIGRDRIYVLDANVGNHRIHVTMPVCGSRIADDGPFVLLCILDGLLVILMVMTRLDSVSQMLLGHFHALWALFGGVSGAPVIRRRSWEVNPVIFACLVIFLGSVVVCGLFFSHTARKAAEDRLLNAAADMHDNIDTCVDQQLFYQGNAICKNYGSPEAMTVDAVKEVMRRYDIDELNVVDSRGIILAGDLAEVGFDMGTNPNTAKFNRLLKGETTYSQPFRGAIENPTIRRKYAGVAFPPPAKGYVQIGFAEHRLKDGLDYRFAAMAKDWRIGEHGFFIVAKDETGEIDSCGMLDASGRAVFKPGDTLAGIGFDVSTAPKNPKEFFRAKLYGEDCLCLTEIMSFHRSIAAMPMSEITGGFRRTIALTSAGLFLLFLIVAVFMSRLSRLVTSLKGYIAEAEKRVEKDMVMAKAIQTNVLPSVFPPYPNLADRIDIFARMRTAKEVGGDFYDFYFVGHGKLALVIADVSGKGVPAAMFMMRAKTTIQALLKGGAGVAEAVAEANNRLADSNEANMFVTAWIGVVDIDTGVIEFVNAGHNPPLVKRTDGTVSYLMEKSGPPLAAIAGVSYRKKELVLAKGEGIVLYTDGVTEAVDPSLTLYGEPRLQQTLTALLAVDESRQIIEGIFADVDRFANGAEQADDITMLAFKLR